MHDLPQLWLPILASAFAVFVASSLIHMLFKWHNSDYRKLPNEDAVLAALRASAATPGQYVSPHCVGMEEMQTEAMQKKYIEGPVAIITLRQPGVPKMGAILGQWFLLNLAVAIAAACISVHVYGLQGDPRYAGHLAGIVTFLVYAGGTFQLAIWMAKPWITVFKDVLDGAIYAAVTALAFWLLWP